MTHYCRGEMVMVGKDMTEKLTPMELRGVVVGLRNSDGLSFQLVPDVSGGSILCMWLIVHRPRDALHHTVSVHLIGIVNAASSVGGWYPSSIGY